VAAFDDEPHMAGFLERLGSFARLICFDWRGTGLSDPFDPQHPPSLERQAQDVLAVLDAAGSEKAAFLASLLSGPAALVLAAHHPSRTSALVLVNTPAGFAAAPGYAFGVPLAVARQFRDEVIEPGTESDTGSVVALHAPSVAGDDEFVRWWEKAGRRGASPGIARAMQTMPCAVTTSAA
jgi:pimeloyl-ACP methyl ester carboxylesterase